MTFAIGLLKSLQNDIAVANYCLHACPVQMNLKVMCKRSRSLYRPERQVAPANQREYRALYITVEVHYTLYSLCGEWVTPTLLSMLREVAARPWSLKTGIEELHRKNCTINRVKLG